MTISRSVRDIIAHYSSFNEKTEYSFTIVRVGKDEFIVTSIESHDIKLFHLFGIYPIICLLLLSMFYQVI